MPRLPVRPAALRACGRPDPRGDRTGKRVGKTAITGLPPVASRVTRRTAVVVGMGGV